MSKPPRSRSGALRPAQQPTPQAASFAVAKHHSGPLPAPEDLARYEQLLPGAAERIIAMAELEQKHRVTMERDAMDSDHQHRNEVIAAQRENARSVFRSDMAGQVLGASIALGCVGGAIYSVYAGANPWVPIAFVSIPVAGIIKAVRAFVTPKKPQQ